MILIGMRVRNQWLYFPPARGCGSRREEIFYQKLREKKRFINVIRLLFTFLFATHYPGEESTGTAAFSFEFGQILV